MPYKINPALLAFARDMRSHPTSAEAYIWNLVRAKRFLHLKFRRQHVIAPYIVDFYCSEIRLVIELDGAQHGSAEGRMYDAERTLFLNALGLTVVRYWNNEVLKQPEMVLEHLWGLVAELKTSP